MVSQVYSCSVAGVSPKLVTIEVCVSNGTKMYIVGLPDSAVRESQQRIESAIKNCGYYMPREKVTVNLAPASLKKEGAAFDLPIALGILQASGQINAQQLQDHLILGELSLSGEIRPVQGVLPITIKARKLNLKSILLCKQNEKEGAIIHNIDVIGLETLEDAVGFLEKKKHITPCVVDTRRLFEEQKHEHTTDFSNIQGQENVKRAMEVACAGGHNVLLIGVPGSGKTMISSQLPSILPPLSLREALETTKIYSVAGQLSSAEGLISQRPFRAPHHTISSTALVGGGTCPMPGEISLAHNGVLFLDELPEFQKNALETLRQPIESHEIVIARAKQRITYPANFMLVASMNPCPCGYYTHPNKPCSCSPHIIQKYQSKISGPLLDRIDIHIEAAPVSFEKLSSEDVGQNETSDVIQKRVIAAREIQKERYKNYEHIHCNAAISANLLREVCRIGDTSKLLLKKAMEKLNLSARAYNRILKLARTIADLAGKKDIDTSHVAEAIQYRSLDKQVMV